MDDMKTILFGIILVAVLLIQPSSQSIVKRHLGGCNGKQFTCINRTAFFVCVDDGGADTEPYGDPQICEEGLICSHFYDYECHYPEKYEILLEDGVGRKKEITEETYNTLVTEESAITHDLVNLTPEDNMATTEKEKLKTVTEKYSTDDHLPATSTPDKFAINDEKIHFTETDTQVADDSMILSAADKLNSPDAPLERKPTFEPTETNCETTKIISNNTVKMFDNRLPEQDNLESTSKITEEYETIAGREFELSTTKKATKIPYELDTRGTTQEDDLKASESISDSDETNLSYPAHKSTYSDNSVFTAQQDGRSQTLKEDLEASVDASTTDDDYYFSYPTTKLSYSDESVYVGQSDGQSMTNKKEDSATWSTIPKVTEKDEVMTGRKFELSKSKTATKIPYELDNRGTTQEEDLKDSVDVSTTDDINLLYPTHKPNYADNYLSTVQPDGRAQTLEENLEASVDASTTVDDYYFSYPTTKRTYSDESDYVYQPHDQRTTQKKEDSATWSAIPKVTEKDEVMTGREFELSTTKKATKIPYELDTHSTTQEKDSKDSENVSTSDEINLSYPTHKSTYSDNSVFTAQQDGRSQTLKEDLEASVDASITVDDYDYYFSYPTTKLSYSDESVYVGESHAQSITNKQEDSAISSTIPKVTEKDEVKTEREFELSPSKTTTKIPYELDNRGTTQEEDLKDSVDVSTTDEINLLYPTHEPTYPGNFVATVQPDDRAQSLEIYLEVPADDINLLYPTHKPNYPDNYLSTAQPDNRAQSLEKDLELSVDDYDFSYATTKRTYSDESMYVDQPHDQSKTNKKEDSATLSTLPKVTEKDEVMGGQMTTLKEATEIPYEFQCPSVGQFPHKYNCSKYHVCVSKGNHHTYFTLNCPGKYYFDSKLKKCSLNPEACITQKEFNQVTTADDFISSFTTDKPVSPVNSVHLVQSDNRDTTLAEISEDAEVMPTPDEFKSYSIHIDDYYFSYPTTKNTEFESSTLKETTEIPYEFQCPSVGKFRHKYNCSKYFLCMRRGANLGYMEFRCPAKFYFDIARQACTLNKDVCKTEIETNKNPILNTYEFECPSNGKFAHRYICSKYFLCARYGNSYKTLLLNCPAKSYFDPVRKRCSLNEEVCTTETETRDIFDNAFQCPTEGKFPHKTFCSKYYVCISKGNGYITRVKSCPGTSVFDPNRKICSLRRGVCIESKNKCDTDGVFRYKDSINQYMICVTDHCANKITKLILTCPGNSIFDIEKKTCIEDHNDGNENGSKQEDDDSSDESNESSNFLCPSAGIFPIKGNCDHYVKCKIKGNSFEVKIIKCSRGNWFDKISLTCKNRNQVTCEEN